MTINRRSFLRSLPAIALLPFVPLPKPQTSPTHNDYVTLNSPTKDVFMPYIQVHDVTNYATCPIVPKYERGYWSCYCTDQCTPSCPSYPPQWIPIKFACGNDNDPHDHAYYT